LKTGINDMNEIMSPIQISRELVRMDSTNPPGGESACAEFLADILRRAGLDVRSHEFASGRTGLLATLRGVESGSPLCFTGHLDTVPLGNAEWTRPPFGGEIEGDRLYGRGACDMKGGVAAMVHAATRLASAGKPPRDVLLILTAGEETGCLGSRAMAEDGYLPEKAAALVVGEPTDNAPVLGHKGALWVRGLVRGKSAHGSMPEHGVNAISRAARAVRLLEDYFADAEEHPLLGRTTVNVGMISGGTKINMVPDKCEFEADVRTVPGLSHAEVVEGLRRALGDLAEITSSIDAEAVYTDPDDPWIARALAAIADVGGGSAEPGYVSYFTDASTLSRAMGEPPTLLLGPGRAGQAHQTDEWCSVNNINVVSEMYYKIASETR
jgi:succinyl-diaminopimelate desuccinylase